MSNEFGDGYGTIKDQVPTSRDRQGDRGSGYQSGGTYNLLVISFVHIIGQSNLNIYFSSWTSFMGSFKLSNLKSFLGTWLYLFTSLTSIGSCVQVYSLKTTVNPKWTGVTLYSADVPHLV